MRIMNDKKSLLCAALDVETSAELLQLAEQLGPYVCAIKTHYDMIFDWTNEVGIKLQELATQFQFLVIEDR